MSEYLTKDWPLGETSTVYMSGKSLFNIRRYGKPGIITSVEMFAADAQAFRDAVNERVADAWDEGAKAAGGYGHEDDWSQDFHPFNDNPYRTTGATA